MGRAVGQDSKGDLAERNVDGEDGACYRAILEIILILDVAFSSKSCTPFSCSL
jgi:hypothetical protein